MILAHRGVHMRQVCMCAGRLFSGKRVLLLMSLTGLLLRCGHRPGRPAPRVSGLIGSDPPFWHASIGIGEGGHVHAHAPSAGGSPRSNDPCGKAGEAVVRFRGNG